MGNIKFSTNEVIFYYQESAEVLFSADLKISNRSANAIYFRIASNNTQYYEITPSQDILHSSATNNILFRLKKSMLAINPRDSYANSFQKLSDVTQKHLFEVQWAVLSD